MYFHKLGGKKLWWSIFRTRNSPTSPPPLLLNQLTSYFFWNDRHGVSRRGGWLIPPPLHLSPDILAEYPIVEKAISSQIFMSLNNIWLENKRKNRHTESKKGEKEKKGDCCYFQMYWLFFKICKNSFWKRTWNTYSNAYFYIENKSSIFS